MTSASAARSGPAARCGSTSGQSPAARPSPARAGAHRRVLDLVGAGQLPGHQLGVADDARPRGRRAPPPARRPRSTALYSATLLVATPIRSATSSTTSPPGSETTTPIAAGPGLPRAPPSTCTSSRGGADVRRGSIGRQLWQLAGDARAPAIADLALAAAAMPPALAARGLAPVDDHRHVGIVGVVGGQLVEQLIGQGSGTTQ